MIGMKMRDVVIMEKNYEFLLIEVEQRGKSNTKRIDEMQKTLESIRDIAMSVNGLAIEMKHMREDQNTLTERLTKIEGRPADRLNYMINTVISAVTGSAMTAILGGVFFFDK